MSGLRPRFLYLFLVYCSFYPIKPGRGDGNQAEWAVISEYPIFCQQKKVSDQIPNPLLGEGVNRTLLLNDGHLCCRMPPLYFMRFLPCHTPRLRAVHMAPFLPPRLMFCSSAAAAESRLTGLLRQRFPQACMGKSGDC